MLTCNDTAGWIENLQKRQNFIVLMIAELNFRIFTACIQHVTKDDRMMRHKLKNSNVKPVR